MKKMFLLIPVGLVAASGLFLVDSYRTPEPSSPKAAESSSKNPEELFTLSQNSLRLILRHGDTQALPELEKSLNDLETILQQYEKQGLSVSKTEKLIAQYDEDSTKLTDASKPYLDKLMAYDSYEDKKEEAFLHSLDQIGLYELKTTYQRLSKKRLDYMKEPSLEAESEYRELAETMKQTVVELYLDGNIEEPLFAYMDNHKRYFETIASFYTKAGVERVHRLRENSYAIKTELQMLPSL